MPNLGQPRTEETRATVLAWTGDDDYHRFGRFVEGKLVGVAGIRIDDVLHHARLYDLVADEARRSPGHGTALVVDWLPTGAVRPSRVRRPSRRMASDAITRIWTT